MTTKILKSLSALLVLLFAFTANTYSQSLNTKINRAKLTKKVLIVLSAADTWTRENGEKYPTGYWAEEFVDVHKEFVDAGYTVDIASPRAVKPTADPKSLEVDVVGAEKAHAFSYYITALSKELNHPLELSKINMADYDAVVIPGGHGPVEDLYKDKDMGKVLFAADKSKKIIGAVCHGQGAFLSAVDSKGNWLFKSRNMTSFSDAEEIEFGTADNAPWLLASTLRKYGANYTCGKNWANYIIVDDNLVTGQNPASSIPMAKAIIELLSKKQSL
ncbi:type 1 glutamine amidotransferase domain-containing protein [Pedobacter alluvionis]|uniref:Glutamine amidotransferase-like class 1 domain-containing protein 1 n=1 Tax=Pedobacter alluvionis TaxID=475253 RepID=A0A497XL44_9SPHI|nr:type 1 glutamine amidotransferase domain-containing protein [Pedobacter alluvionis]RLJ69304.1 putative intracellular protease/amidase [Pedobacter alluvionis]TFB30316.1 type 1 glutamine amidotransferase domain-containing protein [Pedobacter alluvionis]